MNFMAQITDGFSGADLTEISQKAAKAAVRDVQILIIIGYRSINKNEGFNLKRWKGTKL